MKKSVLILLSFSALTWVSCGGGGGGGGNPPPPAVTISISPTSPTVAGGATQQFTATIGNSSNTSVTWQVGGVTGGNATLGTISTSGLFTAPLAIPAGGTVTVKAIAQADTTKSASATVTITFSNAMLNGQYAISYVGYDPFYLVFAGSVVANGSGVISSGIADRNDSVDVFPNITVTGTYAVSADGRVQITLNDSLGNDYTFRAVMISPDRLRVIQFDSPATLPPQGATGQGFIERQDTASFSNAAFTGGYAFRLDGPGFTGCTAGFAGRMTANGAGVLSAGVMDSNECGVDDNLVSFTGLYDIAASGRGTATLTTTLGTMNFAVYMVSAGKAHLISLDLFPWMLGFAEKQTQASFSESDLTGNYAYFVTGFSQTGIYFSAGRLTADGLGAVSAGISDENDDGVTAENLAFTGGSDVAANGRGTASLTSTRGTSDISFYLVSPSRALFVQQGVFAVATGEIDAQSASPSQATFTGDYGLSMDGFPGTIVAQFTSNGTGSISGMAAINFWDDVNLEFVPEPDDPFTGTYTVTSTGRGDFTVTDVAPPELFHIYVISGNKVHIIGMDDLFLGSAEKQF